MQWKLDLNLSQEYVLHLRPCLLTTMADPPSLCPERCGQFCGSRIQYAIAKLSKFTEAASEFRMLAPAASRFRMLCRSRPATLRLSMPEARRVGSMFVFRLTEEKSSSLKGLELTH